MRTTDSSATVALRGWWRYGTVWLWSGVVLFLCLGGTFLLWNHSEALSRAESRYEFEFVANKVVTEVTEHLDAHEQTLWGIASLFASNPQLGPREWAAYVDGLKLDQRLPNTRGVSFTAMVADAQRADHVAKMRDLGFDGYDIRPEGRRSEYLVVAFISPYGDRTNIARGYDVLTEPVRRAAAMQARDSGQSALTAKLALLSDHSWQPQIGFILYVPAYRQGAPLETVEQRRAAFLGIASSPFRAREFVMTRGVAEQLRYAGLSLEVFDGAGTSDEELLFRSDDHPSLASQADGARPTTIVAERVSGRTWTFRFTKMAPLTSGVDQYISVIVLWGGIIISLLASLAVGTMTLNRARTIEANKRLREDVARWERAEEKVRQSEVKFRRLFDSIPLPTFAMDRETLRFFAVNSAAVERYGYSHEEFTSMRITDIRPPEDVPALLRYIESVRDHESYAGEFRHALRDGTLVDVEIMAHRLEFDGQRLTVVIAQDVTERKRAEKALAESEHQLRQVQKLEAVGQLTGGIAHDFNNILTVITGTIEILGEGVADDPKLANIARLIREAADRGADLTSDLLAFARRQPLDPQDVDVNELVVGASKLFRSTITQKIEIECQLEHEPWPGFVDPTQLTTALLNLTLNARDAMPNGGKLLLETANAVIDEGYAARVKDVRAGPYVMVSVSDNGEGIPEVIRDKVFEPFFTTKDVGKGTGLGLSMVYGFVKQSGGHIQILSEEGRGTTVRLYLPRANVVAPSVAPAAPTPAVIGGRETILVVEDDALVRTCVTEQLHGLGYSTLVAANAEEAIAIAEQGNRFDLLFTDVVMPGPMNGRQLAQTLRSRRPDLRVLFTSGYSEHAAIGSGDRGCSGDMLRKPYRKVELARKIRRVLDATIEINVAMIAAE